MHKLKTLYFLNGVKGQSGVIWGHKGHILIFTRNALSLVCYLVYSCNSYTCITFAGSTGKLGSVRGQCLMSQSCQGMPSVMATCPVFSVSIFFFFQVKNVTANAVLAVAVLTALHNTHFYSQKN